ncbi:response regulator [Sphingomonas sp. Leaf343]|uniref:response regulator n=1 Tax=Sphingomonas sp. Leaf343 TaxID=1736345 RepID=UPI0006F90AA6|nr:response regulator transcription factor [Sphingomonas sp. Leaf343]KQR87449.1 two-component system response regulator [Sphingomonas sp. Leaf343]
MILIVDDEPHVRRLLATILSRGGYDVAEAGDARSAMGLVPRAEAVLLDLGLPDRDGLEVLSDIRRISTAPVLIVSAREAAAEKVAALDLGADDYVTKPFDGDELLARLRAALRRRGAVPARVVTAGDVTIDADRRSVTKAGAEVHLTRKEYALLAMLATHPGRIVTHAQLLTAIWGPAHVEDIAYLRVAARGLRVKLEDDPSRPVLIRNEPGIGYRLVV